MQELANALAATYDSSGSNAGNSKDAVQRLATAREQLLGTCNQLRDYLVSQFCSLFKAALLLCAVTLLLCVFMEQSCMMMCLSVMQMQAQLKQAYVLGKQQIDQMLQHPQGEQQKPTVQATAPSGTPVPDSMDVDQQQSSTSASDIAALINQQHSQFLSQLSAALGK